MCIAQTSNVCHFVIGIVLSLTRSFIWIYLKTYTLIKYFLGSRGVQPFFRDDSLSPPILFFWS